MVQKPSGYFKRRCQSESDGMIYDWEFRERCECSDEEKNECMPVVSNILSLAIKARHLGLLTLVKDIEETTSFLLKKGIQLIVDGVKPHTVRTILEFYILTGNYRGKALLQRCLILEGVLAILEGVHPKVIKEILIALLGEDGHEGFEVQLDTMNADFINEIRGMGSAAKSMLADDMLKEMVSDLTEDTLPGNLVEESDVELAKDKLDDILSDLK